jgi:hypothetical protein
MPAHECLVSYIDVTQDGITIRVFTITLVGSMHIM